MRLGIHTHALSSLTIKSTSHTNTFLNATLYALYTLVFIMPVNIQLSKISIASAISWSCQLTAELCLVGPDGIEPSTSPLSGVRSSHLSYGPRCLPNTGGAGRDRTGDLLSANQALSQLSYSPFLSSALPLFRKALPSRCNRGQLDTGIRDIKPPTAFRFTCRTSSGVPVACSLPVP